ncbi:HAMP domain-containing sensor histidine kinase [Clostridium sp. YIM B02555]|uniref:sensor histidine kinase n=1 Tax=Clostridium sp. YIM B02555 TaxID=2911968 RepID=UPI001EEED6A8|nr:HAMP domain-containing sensor histidine kinase [Clostridium sp. YIM B02555]
MDTNLKITKKTINKKFIILSLCIAILPILLGLSKGFFQLEKFSYEDYFLNVIRSIHYKDGDGNIREDRILDTINNLKAQDNYEFNESKRELEDFSKKFGLNLNEEVKPNENKNISEDDYSTYTDLNSNYIYAQKNINRSQNEYRTEAISQINHELDDKKITDNQKNIEFYVESQDGQIISNIKDKSKHEIVQETKNNSKYHIIILDINKELPTEVDITSNMKWAYKDFFENNKVNWMLSSYNYKNIIVRLSNPLLPGDEIYPKFKKNAFYDYIAYGSLALLLLDLCILIISVKKIIKEKDLEIHKNIILKLLNRFFIESRVLLIGLFIALLIGLYNSNVYLGNSIIENYISQIVDNIYLLKVNSNTFFEQVFFLFIGSIILGYFIICDLYQLYLCKNIREFKQYVHRKSILRILYNKFKNSMSCISTTNRTTILSIIIALYLALIIWGTVYTSQNVFFFARISGYIITFLAINLLGIISLIVNTALSIINTQKIKAATDNILNGNYKNEIKIHGSFLLKELANNITNIEAGLNKAIAKAVKSERMKGELITNVSHDLKTPLTSIINYVDLLDKDNLTEEKKSEYLAILKERSSRLKVLIEDLFEASKASSGNLELHMESLDPVALLRQTLGEFEDRIINSNLDFIKTIPEHKLTIYADGKRTFRVFQNLISNILKYSLNGTRVYIDIEDKDTFVSITFKNISKYPLTFTEDEILERFKRGDSSRTTEGSGLGLAIAKSLVEIQKGIFELKFDGDLFKVKILLKKENF